MPVRCRLEVVGTPSPTNVLVFNGDFVDRGAWYVGKTRGQRARRKTFLGLGTRVRGDAWQAPLYLPGNTKRNEVAGVGAGRRVSWIFGAGRQWSKEGQMKNKNPEIFTVGENMHVGVRRGCW